MKKIMFLLMLASLMFGSTGCKDKSGSSSNSNEIVIGEYVSLTGDTSVFGTSSHKGLQLALDEVNAKGVLGKKIKVISEDDQSKPSEAMTAVQKLISRDKVVAVIGEVASTRSLAGGGVCQKAGIPMLTPASTNPAVTQIGDCVFRICYTDDYQGTVAAQFALKEMPNIEKKVWKRVAIFTDSASDYSKGLAKAFKDYYPSHGGEIVAEETFRAGETDFRTSLDKIKNAGVDAVFFPAYYGDVSNALRQARQIQLNVPFFGGDGWDSHITLELGAVANNCFYTNHYSSEDQRPETQNFVKNFKAKYNEIPDAMATLGYDAMLVMADAVERAGSADPVKIKQALGATKNFKGATGAITIDENRNAKKPIVVLRLMNGKATLVDSLTP